jgi:hypothetical protein
MSRLAINAFFPAIAVAAGEFFNPLVSDFREIGL